MKIVYFDNHVVVIGKPPGIPSQSEDEESAEKKTRSWAKEQFEKKGEAFIHALHRLDKPVSGLLLLAKTSKALERLHKSFRNKEMKKTYIALVEGILPNDSGVLENYLVHEEFRATIKSATHPDAKYCRLSYRVLEKNSFCTLVEIDLDTGRYHQIRCQFAHFGHPIVGDLKYGARFIGGKHGHIALHHQKMTFPHPISKELLSFEIDPPKKWGDWISELSIYFK